MNIGFMGFGEAAYNISLGLNAENPGAATIRAFDMMQDSPGKRSVICRRAEEAGVELLPNSDDIVLTADVVFAAVPSGSSLSVCKEVIGSLRSGQIYADVSASTPAAKEELWFLLKPKGVLFTDAAMLGSLPRDKHKVPITASGNGARAFHDAMTPLGMVITPVGDSPGAASAIKLMRSVFMKGIAACMFEMLQGADSYNVRSEVISSISKSMDGIQFVDHLDRLVAGTAIHAERRAAELKGAEKMLAECGLDAMMSRATRGKHELISEYGFAQVFNEAGPHWNDIIEAMRDEKQEEKTCL